MRKGKRSKPDGLDLYSKWWDSELCVAESGTHYDTYPLSRFFSFAFFVLHIRGNLDPYYDARLYVFITCGVKITPWRDDIQPRGAGDMHRTLCGDAIPLLRNG